MTKSPLQWNKPEILRDLALLSLALVVGLVIQMPAWSLLVAVVLWGAFHLTEFIRFTRWTAHPLKQPLNRVSVWRQPGENLYRVLRRARLRSHRLLRDLRRFQHTYDAIPDGAVIITANGKIERLNRAAATLLAIHRSDLGQNLVSLVRHPDLVSLIDGRVESNIIELSLPHDQARHLEIRRIFISGERWLILTRDVTELNRLLTMRQEFVANVSHEIRTPLTIIMGYLETLSEGDLNAEGMLAILARMNSPAYRMQALVEDLSLLTRLESSPAPGIDQLKRVNVSAMLQELTVQAEQLSQGRHQITLSTESIALFALESELHSAFNNLITNAMRYSPEGGEIAVSWFMTGTGVRFEVRDQGIGISPEHLSRLTERFYRIDFSGSRVKGGTGLGLAIVKHVLKHHNSTLEVSSVPGQGSLFACEFPLTQIAADTDMTQEGTSD